jgi:ornithine decarboxylase
MMEAVQTGGRWHFPLLTSRPDHFSAPSIPTTVTGPSCDSSDTMFYGVPLPATLEVGDRVYIGSAGAYTTSYASSFNGFPPPRQLFVGGARTKFSPEPAADLRVAV